MLVLGFIITCLSFEMTPLENAIHERNRQIALGLYKPAVIKKKKRGREIGYKFKKKMELIKQRAEKFNL